MSNWLGHLDPLTKYTMNRMEAYKTLTNVNGDDHEKYGLTFIHYLPQ